jgi:hypothetical protein
MVSVKGAVNPLKERETTMKIQTLIHKDGSSAILYATRKAILKMVRQDFHVSIFHKGYWAQISRIKGVK